MKAVVRIMDVMGDDAVLEDGKLEAKIKMQKQKIKVMNEDIRRMKLNLDY